MQGGGQAGAAAGRRREGSELKQGAAGGSGAEGGDSRLPGGTDVPEEFEEALVKLEALVAELEKGDLPLEETIQRFEEGQRLLRICSDKLQKAEFRVKEILRRADGSLEEQNLKGADDEAL